MGRTDQRPTGFTLVEMFIVVLLLGIVAAIVVPSIDGETSDAEASALAANVGMVSMMLEYQHGKAADGQWPAGIDEAWFASGDLPGHPQAFPGVPTVEVVNTAAATHPRNKLIVPGCQGAYWYNRANGAFRARVAFQGDNTETLAFYNLVNGSSVSSLTATSAVAVGSLLVR